MSDTLYSYMVEAFQPYLYVIIGCLAVIIILLIAVVMRIGATNRTLESFKYTDNQ